MRNFKLSLHIGLLPQGGCERQVIIPVVVAGILLEKVISQHLTGS